MKNLLIANTTDENVKDTEMRSEVSHTLGNTQISDAKFTSVGNIVKNFEEEKVRDETAGKLENVDKVTSVRKL